ncbi:patatin-domain-containing protein [Bimuria novae-zelandiae CBS 107.79]|uniref:Patatin-domain-containing protein n=1 Tax=Bimuria novae-zelandiae CBS 107.79 TaxID=1447943 RepID=A0A6A5V7B4_9PLEO|nr:patatin-domain-containing protein [Bimuria novae-zelandiae CBS 107.79]
MADIIKESDGPQPEASDGFDPTLLPDYDDDFVNEPDFAEFEKALQAPETSPSTEDLTASPPEEPKFITALNDWRPVHQRVKRRKRSKKPPRRGKDETREGVFYEVLKYPLLLLVFGWLAFLSVSYVLTRFYIYAYERAVSWRGRRQQLRRQLQEAKSYEDWIKGAKQLDTHLGNDQWKAKPDYAYYDSKTIHRVHQQMARLRQKAEDEEKQKGSGQHKAAEELRSLLEACIKNNFAGFENPRLYSETYYGTKDLLQAFIDESERSLSFLLTSSQLDQESKRSMFKQLSTNFGRTALCLSGGATFAYYHFGVAKALMDAGLMPEVITGTSGGALVAALLGTRTDDELKKLLIPALAHRITACHDSFWVWFKRWRLTGARFECVDWARRCAWFTRGSMTFKEAYQRTGRILNVSCVPSDPHSPTILANYLTAPDCVIWSAVIASAAVPGVLNPVVLMKKNKEGTLSPYSFGHKWKDGSLRTDIPLKALNLHFNVRFSIVSQVNPHINIFFFSSRGTVGRPVTHRRGRGWRGGFIGSALEQYIKLDLNKWLKVLRHLELLPRPLGQDWSEIWLQRFRGTITIWPKTIPSDFRYILTDPTPERLARMIRVGASSSYPKLKFVENRAKLEHVIQQGRRQFRPRSGHDGGLVSVLSEDDLQTLLKRSKNEGEDATPYPLSASESSSSAGPSRPGTPFDLPLGFSFSTKQKKAPTRLTTSPPQGSTGAIPSSPSLSKRLSGWWSSLSPRDANASTALDKPRARPRNAASISPPSASPHATFRPNSMIELRPSQHQLQPGSGSMSPSRVGSLFREIRRQSRVFVDDSDDDDDALAGFGDAGKRYEGGDDPIEGVDAGAEEYVGDDEDDGEHEGDVQAVGTGLGLEGTAVE